MMPEYYEMRSFAKQNCTTVGAFFPSLPGHPPSEWVALFYPCSSHIRSAFELVHPQAGTRLRTVQAGPGAALGPGTLPFAGRVPKEWLKS